MTFSCRYFADGSQYGQYDFAKFMDDAYDNGYVSGAGNELKCSSDGTDMRITIATGRGYINGYSFDVEDAPEYVTIPTAHATYDRIDRIVARLSPDVNKNISLAVVQGTPASTPVAPAITRSSSTYDISLCSVRVPAGSSFIPSANVTDERNDYTVCGCANHVEASTIDRGTINYQRLPKATSSSVGAVKPGYGLEVDANGTLNAVISQLTGYFSPSIPADMIGFIFYSYPTITPTITDNSTISGYNVTYDVTMTFTCSRYYSRFRATKVGVGLGVNCYSNKTSMITTEYPCLSVTASLLKDGTTVETKTDTSVKKLTFNLDSQVTIDDLINHTWKITGTATLDSQGSTEKHYEPLAAEKALKYFVIDK